MRKQIAVATAVVISATTKRRKTPAILVQRSEVEVVTVVVLKNPDEDVVWGVWRAEDGEENRTEASNERVRDDVGRYRYARVSTVSGDVSIACGVRGDGGDCARIGVAEVGGVFTG